MKLVPTEMSGAFTIHLEPMNDQRGFFAKTFSAEIFAAYGLPTKFAEAGLSFNQRRGTLRGLHFQMPPHSEAKMVRCDRGEIFDVIVDLRAGSPSFGHWLSTHMTAENRNALFVPRGFAHGFQTLADNTEVSYLITQPYVARSAGGVRWDDPSLAVDWPLEPTAMSQRDRCLPCLSDAAVPFNFAK